jgi:7-keto-8-aminopelargonate synthetase-like enzyme
LEYIRKIIKVLDDTDLYPDVRIIDDVPYPELVIDNKKYLCLCSNNYLGLSIHPEVKKAAIDGIKRYGIGTCDSRLIAGNLRLLEDLEQAINEFNEQ